MPSRDDNVPRTSAADVAPDGRQRRFPWAGTAVFAGGLVFWLVLFALIAFTNTPDRRDAERAEQVETYRDGTVSGVLPAQVASAGRDFPSVSVADDARVVATSAWPRGCDVWVQAAAGQTVDTFELQLPSCSAAAAVEVLVQAGQLDGAGG